MHQYCEHKAGIILHAQNSTLPVKSTLKWAPKQQLQKEKVQTLANKTSQELNDQVCMPNSTSVNSVYNTTYQGD